MNFTLLKICHVVVLLTVFLLVILTQEIMPSFDTVSSERFLQLHSAGLKYTK